MKHVEQQIVQIVRDIGADLVVVSEDERRDIDQAWLATFARNVKRQTGHWIHERFRWHGFSYRFEKALEGHAALESYRKQWAAPYVVFGETGGWCYRCTSETYPDFSELRADVYVVHHNMKWSMAFTHEQPDIGPFFAVRN